MAAMHMALMAVNLGLGTCFCGILDFPARHGREPRDLLGLPEGHIVPISFMLGYPKLEYPRQPGRKPARVRWM